MEREEFIIARRNALLANVPYSAIREIEKEVLFPNFIVSKLLNFEQIKNQFALSVSIGTDAFEFLYTNLTWDTNYFGLHMVRLNAVLYHETVRPEKLAAAVHLFMSDLRARGVEHCYCEVVSTDSSLLYALGHSKWSLVETRLHYYHDKLNQIREDRFRVRLAVKSKDDSALRRIAMANRNMYDRFHADPAFTSSQADSFLGEYAVAALNGYCDAVLVPSLEPLDSFMAISHLDDDANLLGVSLGRIVLTAVGAVNRGWHRKLVSESLHYTRERGGKLMLMTTQVTNRAVINNSEYLGFKLGGSTHIMSIKLV